MEKRLGPVVLRWWRCVSHSMAHEMPQSGSGSEVRAKPKIGAMFLVKTVAKKSIRHHHDNGYTSDRST